MKLSGCINNASYRAQRVLGVSKLSFLEYLRWRNPDLSEEQILSMMKEQGKNPQEIVAEHQRQIACEQNLAAVLKKFDISFRITKRIEDAAKCMKWTDLVIPIGGDGTFLLASKLITNNAIPVLGINPDTSSSSNILTFPTKHASDIESIFEKLHKGEYRALKPSAQKKIADALKPRQRILPWLALNEVFLGEFLAARPISLLVQFENQEPFHIRCSGICVCTGSGSQSWYKSMNVQSTETVRSIVEIATGKKLSPEETNELLHKYYQTLEYPVEDLKMAYKIREMYHTTRCPKYKCCPDRLKCNKLTVTSSGFDAGLVIDGCISLPFNDGTVASFEILPQYSLKNIIPL